MSQINKYTFHIWSPLWGLRVCLRNVMTLLRLWWCPFTTKVLTLSRTRGRFGLFAHFCFYFTSQYFVPAEWPLATALRHNSIQVKTFIAATVTPWLDSDSCWKTTQWLNHKTWCSQAKVYPSQMVTFMWLLLICKIMILSNSVQMSEFSSGGTWQLCQDLSDSLTVKEMR